MYAVDDEGLEEDGTVGSGAGQFVNHSYFRVCKEGKVVGGAGSTEGWRGATQTDILRGRSWKTGRKSHKCLKSGIHNN